jgi:hypothetical protein
MTMVIVESIYTNSSSKYLKLSIDIIMDEKPCYNLSVADNISFQQRDLPVPCYLRTSSKATTNRQTFVSSKLHT